MSRSLVLQITVEQISLNLTAEINTVLKLKKLKFCANRSIFVRTETQVAKHHS